ncbi:uncharacterized protein LOC134230709 [Saccostrea cucullata]|uniref:uncharacterized protein LOC134230709 n=1 Tax=Saccostrea cuccullata TaxID=36930 RepID=UPI002ED429CD
MGPYFANGKNNDSSIITHFVKSNSGNFMDFMEEHDVLIVDRGFRDALEFLQSCGFRTEMPPYLDKALKQHSTKEANLSRCVTKIKTYYTPAFSPGIRLVSNTTCVYSTGMGAHDGFVRSAGNAHSSSVSDPVSDVFSEDYFNKLQEKNIELQKKRAEEVEALDSLKRQLDKSKQEASRLWDEKEHYKRVLQATDTSVLQHQIAKEHAKVIDLTKQIQSLLKEKENLLTRLSEVAGSKLTSNNPAITDLSDENRPLKLAEKFSQLYDDDWTDSLEEITSTGVDEKTSISLLQRVVMIAFHLCSRSQTILVNAKCCWTVCWCDIVKLKVLHEIQLPDATKLEVDRAVKRCSHDVQKDLICRTQKRFRHTLADMLRVTTNEKAYSQMAPVNYQSEQLESNKKESKGEQKKPKVKRDFNIPVEHNVLKPKLKRSFSTACIVVDGNNTDSKDVIPGKEKQTAPSRHGKYRNRLADSARGDFLRPRYENYVREGFLLGKDSIEKLFLEPRDVIDRFPKTAQFADRCIELCWLMQSTQPPVHLSVDIPESRELKHETFKAYTKSGHCIDYVVWPAMYLHKEGPLLSKGVAQPL